jgi:hypothetical protein
VACRDFKGGFKVHLLLALRGSSEFIGDSKEPGWAGRDVSINTSDLWLSLRAGPACNFFDEAAILKVACNFFHVAAIFLAVCKFFCSHFEAT